MVTKFCANCGAQQVEGAAFCPSCGTPAAAVPPAQAAAPQQPQPAAYQPQPVPQQQQPYAAPPPTGGPGMPGQGMSRNTKIGIAVAVVLAIVIAYLVRENEREFQRNRRANQAPVATGAPPATPPAAPAQQGGSAPAPYGGYNSGGTPGSPEWTRHQLVGRWGMRDCVTTTAFRADGTTFSTNGTQSLSGTWTYQHPRLTVVEPGGTTLLEIVQMGDLEMRTEAQGRQQTWRRCGPA